MNKKLTITVSEVVYEGLHRVVGRRRISQFIEQLVRPHIAAHDIETSYREMAADETREQEALEWSEGVIADASAILERARKTEGDPERISTESHVSR